MRFLRGAGGEMRHKNVLLCAVLGAASFHASACYTVYDRQDRVVYQSLTPPVDMSRPLHETLPARFPGGHMIFDSGECRVISSVASGGGARDMSTRSPLLTNERTAVAQKMPHKTLPGGIALVQPADATLAPGLTVLPTTRRKTSSVPNTAVMGNGPRRGGVITELRDPPVVIEEYDGKVIRREMPR
jgi:hypothetical protein